MRASDGLKAASDFQRVSLRTSVLFLLCWLVLLLSACSSDPLPLEVVEAPQDLGEMDRSVRSQFEQLWLDGGQSSPSPALRGNWGALAQWFHAYRYPDSAARSYANAILVEPAEPRWPYLLAVLLAEQGESARARELFQAALELAPRVQSIHVRLGDLARQGGDLDAAEAYYRQALSLSSTDAGARFGLGQLALLRGDAEMALHWLEPLSREQPDAAVLNYAMATALRLSGDLAGAQDLLERVPDENLHQIGLRQDDPWWTELLRIEQGSREVSRRAVQAVRRGEHQRAAVLFGIAVQRDPEGAEERLNWALALSRLGHHQQALEQIQEAVARAEPGSDLHARVRTEAARLQTQAGRPRQALAILENLLGERPEQTRARVQLASLLHSFGDLQGALRQYETLRELGDFSADLAFWQVAAHLALDRRDRAAEQLIEDLSNYPEARQLRLLQWRLMATEVSTDQDLLQSVLRQAVQAMGDPPGLLEAETQAMLYAALDEYEAAIAWQEAVTDALSAESEAASLQIARRRLTLYREGKRPSRAWEANERLIAVPLQNSPAELPSLH
ncbi:tetratricopeptide repeat protein [Wenzhouxiangella marina]|uniref:Uncharacterized protein n=2 Tax=Wenzhouxiangella marina TaxID=1579979 RepID=A0A0K0XV84_9GAMM|nr:tetratricopeptide repeat protein [Wenzhouxiangella marina]AKS41531.1 hypothetical protein WM2015_1157 [Wenzhouxiangella marina]